ncbi:glutamyl-tRNA reductase [Candidatus Sulfidibacterium hydrothermale]|uniref:glutamyl-tRNA reductase n=1 Tax=Candidatus Sulfidibacterium hydrothermale TaxID=2875962 RepID=UPI001F0AC979|nr:glutamyl-tRNA reductase [Candidatus Sulfidibacterium hydrothermale]UBM63526.1 glutamyl-tRNA reductase [Candidatus Sulfidibacterium hydrothermale]
MTALIGISYKTADLEIREQFAFSAEEIISFSKTLIQNQVVEGMVILSTCNRTEIYYHANNQQKHQAQQEILKQLAAVKTYNDTLKSNFYFYENEQTVEHLFKVVSGIDSLIVGEDQIIGQVKEAFQFAKEHETTDKILNRLFLKALETGKKVRTQTEISRGSASASSAAVNLCHQRFPDLSQQSLLMIGAGQTGQLVLNSLRKSTFRSLHIANRTFQKAEELARLHQGQSIPLEAVNQYLADSDIVFIATDSPEPLVKLEAVKEAIRKRTKKQKQLFFDLSVPRNIEEEIGKLEEIELFTIDDLTKIVESTNQKRMEEISAAMQIIRRATRLFLTWENEQELVPAILKIKENFHRLNQTEIEEFKKIRSVKDDKLINEYSRHITEKFARVFIKNLKELSKEADKKDFISMAEAFFDL